MNTEQNYETPWQLMSTMYNQRTVITPVFLIAN